MADRKASHWFSTRAGAAFSEAIKERDGFVCQMCGCIIKKGRGHARAGVTDHIRPVALRPDLERDPDNCRTVCRTCHAVCHSIEARHDGEAEAIAAAKLAYRPVGLDGYPVGP